MLMRLRTLESRMEALPATLQTRLQQSLGAAAVAEPAATAGAARATSPAVTALPVAGKTATRTWSGSQGIKDPIRIYIGDSVNGWCVFLALHTLARLVACARSAHRLLPSSLIAQVG